MKKSHLPVNRSHVFFLIMFGMIPAVFLFSSNSISAGPSIKPKAPQTLSAPQQLPPVIPEFQVIVEVVEESLAVRGKYYENDLIDQADAVKIFKRISQAGWDVPNSQSMVGRFLPVNDFLVKELGTKKGISFMRRMSQFPGGYDRLDRLRYIPKGKRAVTSLINDVGGEEMIEYMTTTQQGKNMGSLIANSRNGKNFNDLTGRIYTGKQLLAELKLLHDQAMLAISQPVGPSGKNTGKLILTPSPEKEKKEIQKEPVPAQEVKPR